MSPHTQQKPHPILHFATVSLGAPRLPPEELRPEAHRRRVVLVPGAALRCGNALHDLVDVLAAASPRRLAAHLAGDCSAHRCSLTRPTTVGAVHSIPPGVYDSNWRKQ